MFYWPMNIESNFYKGQMIAGIVFADRFISELGNTLCERNLGCDFIVMIDPGSRKVHYRTIKSNVDVSKIAAINGGGGHRAASGHVFNDLVQDNIVRAVFGIEVPDENESEFEGEPDRNPEPEIEEPKKPWWKKLFGGRE
jgi:oligoribonuclease NrnB/cAMP/cGMP phosphodiesterase (DHH superfamily)